jgi:hypothetical protein
MTRGHERGDVEGERCPDSVARCRKRVDWLLGSRCLAVTGYRIRWVESVSPLHQQGIIQVRCMRVCNRESGFSVDVKKGVVRGIESTSCRVPARLPAILMLVSQ